MSYKNEDRRRKKRIVSEAEAKDREDMENELVEEYHKPKFEKQRDKYRMRDLIFEAKKANTLLLIIAMFIAGIFIKLVFG